MGLPLVSQGQAQAAGAGHAMSGREFSKVSPALWRSARFAGLSDKGQIAYLYFITNAHVTSAGCYVLPDGYACADLNWTLADYHQARDECRETGLIDYEGDTVFVERWFKHNPPMNANHATGTMKQIAAIEADRLREKTEAAFTVANDERIEREAANAAARAQAKARKEAEALLMAGNGNSLANTRYMNGGRG
jgi:hypothetical protein